MREGGRWKERDVGGKEIGGGAGLSGRSAGQEVHSGPSEGAGIMSESGPCNFFSKRIFQHGATYQEAEIESWCKSGAETRKCLNVEAILGKSGLATHFFYLCCS